MRELLFDYQKKIFDEQKKEKSNALFMGIGTGKTITSIALMEEKPVDRVLVVCLKAKLNDWKEEYNHYTGKKFAILNKGKKNKELLDDKSYDGYVVTFQSVWRNPTLLDIIDNDWGIIVDESQMIKNRKAKVTKFMLQLGKKTPYKIILTGTQQSQGYVDYWSQMTFLGKWDIGITNFHKRYCNMGRLYLGKSFIPVIESYKNTEELDEMILSNSVFYTRKPGDKVPLDNYVELNKHRDYDRFFKDKVLEKNGEYILGDTTGAYRMRLKQLASNFIAQYDLPKNEKIDWVKDFLLSYDERIVIFYNFNKELEHLKKALKDRPYSEFNGHKQDLTNFKENRDGVALVNYGSGSTGINDLVLSEVAIFYSPTDDVITFQQARGRLDRIGQERKPLFYFLKTKGTIETAIYRSLQEGKDFDDRLFKEYIDNYA